MSCCGGGDDTTTSNPMGGEESESETLDKIKIPYLVDYFGKKKWKDAWDGGKVSSLDTHDPKTGDTTLAWDWRKAAAKGQVLNMARAKKTDDGKFSKLEPGIEDDQAALYPVWGTGSDDLGDFGLGVGLYFKTIIIMGALMIVLFILNSPSMAYYIYNYGQYPGDDNDYFGYNLDGSWIAFLGFLPVIPLRGTAVCPSHAFLLEEGNGKIDDDMEGGAVMRQVFKKNDQDQPLKWPQDTSSDDGSWTYDGTTYQEGTRFINDCPFNQRQGWLDLAGSVFMLLLILIMGKVQGELAEAIDESVQTAQDYSVEVEDPGDTPQDQDPLVWKKYFEQFGPVTSIAIIKKNGELMNFLTERRAKLTYLKKMGWAKDPVGDEKGNLVPEAIRAHLKKGKIYPTHSVTTFNDGGTAKEEGSAGGQPIPNLPDEVGNQEPPSGPLAGLKMNPVYKACRDLGKLHKKIEDELGEKLDDMKKTETGDLLNARVYATFENENDQRFCLDVLSTGSMWALIDRSAPAFVTAFMEFYNNFGCSVDMIDGDGDGKFTYNFCKWKYYLGPNGAKKPAWQERKEEFMKNLDPTGKAEEPGQTRIKFGDNVLKVTLAPEPSDIRWENLDTEPKDVAIAAAITTTLGLIAVGILSAISYGLMLRSPAAGAISISVFNSLLPAIMKTLNSYEAHPTHTNTEASLLFKLVSARLVLFGLVPYLTTPWHTTLAPATDMGGGLILNNYNKAYEGTPVPANIKKILTILVSDALLGPLIRVLNIGGNIAYFQGTATAKSPEHLDEMFKGAAWMLSERFSDMTKTIYVTLFFSALAPIAYLLCAVAMFNTYWVDKYLLLRVWQVPPQLDASIVATTRSHLAFIVLLHIVVTMWYYAGWPFDEVICKDSDGKQVHPSNKPHKYSEWDDTTLCTSSGGYSLFKKDEQVNDDYFLLFNMPGTFTSDQVTIVRAYQVFGVLSMVLICMVYMGAGVQNTLYTIFFGIPKDTTDVATRPEAKSGKDSDGHEIQNGAYFIPGKGGEPIGSSTVEDLEYYVPQFSHPGLEVPQLAIYHPDLNKKDPSDKTDDEGIEVYPEGKPMHIEDWNAKNAPENNHVYFDEDTARDMTTGWSTVPPAPMFPGQGVVETWFPAQTALSWNENRAFKVAYHRNSLWNDPVLQHLSEKDRLKFFSSVTTFQVGDEEGTTKRLSMLGEGEIFRPANQTASLGIEKAEALEEASIPLAPPSAGKEDAVATVVVPPPAPSAEEEGAL